MMFPGDETVPTPPTEDWPALEAAVKRFENAWRQGARPAIDDYVPGANAAGDFP